MIHNGSYLLRENSEDALVNSVHRVPLDEALYSFDGERELT